MIIELYTIIGFLTFLMLLFVAFVIYILRLFLATFMGITKTPAPESAESDFNPVSTGGVHVEEYLDRLGGDRFTSPATFAMNRTSIAEEPADTPEGFAETDPSEIAIV